MALYDVLYKGTVITSIVAKDEDDALKFAREKYGDNTTVKKCKGTIRPN